MQSRPKSRVVASALSATSSFEPPSLRASARSRLGSQKKTWPEECQEDNGSDSAPQRKLAGVGSRSYCNLQCVGAPSYGSRTCQMTSVSLLERCPQRT